MKQRDTKICQLEIDRMVDVPLREISGICVWRSRSRKVSLVAVGDHAAHLAWTPLSGKRNGKLDWHIIDITKLADSELPKRDPQIEAVCADGGGRVLLLQESAKLKRRTLAARLDALAERYVRDLESDPGVDLDKLAAALELAKMAKLAALGRRRRRRGTLSPLAPAKAGAQRPQAPESPAEVLARLRAEGVNFDRAPESAVKDFIDSHRPPEDDRHFRQRGGKSRRKRAHRQMFDWGRD